MKYAVKVNGELFEVEVDALTAGESVVTSAPAAPAVAPSIATKPAAPAPAPAAPAAGHKGTGAQGEITAPMPGNVWEVKVNVGDGVSIGDVVMVLEAMKMEIEVTATAAGTVKQIVAPKGTAVNTGDVLILLG